MAYNPYLLSRNIRDMEYNKYTEIINDTRFPAITSVLTGYDYEDGIKTNIYNKTAELMYMVNASDITQNVTLSATQINVTNVGISGVAAVSGTVTVASISAPVTVQTSTNTLAVSSGITTWDVLSASITSSVGGVTFTALPSNGAKSIQLSNQTGTSLNIKRTTGSGVSFPLPTASVLTLSLITNTNEISISQNSGTAVTVYATYTF